ncbi:MAG: glycoside hydrolase family 10 protein [Gomphosphaeria aponina SAG 52.96 = DSM 107014]|uniref:Glycoside hydrolase family 10 protein n=1 Tax=Gomphosphaeria aponina SAG 52.96 = DSM 107014 TaxID=1521640 RepID=A0A941JTM8_9CHRO|nr:glycoside hydrolase family 10 protein [Gomphosphaeria aponina SAG 52.96 = DSM 107014]
MKGFFPFPPLFRLQVWLLFLLTLAFFTPVIISSEESPTEIRGVWLTNIDSDVLFSWENTTNAIETLAQLHFNTVYPTVWNWGYTLYPSQVAEAVTGVSQDPAPALQGRDVLQEIISHTQENGLAVIPWFEFGFMAPADSELAISHPQWLTHRQDSSRIWLEGNVHQRVWLNPLHPEVQQFITDLVVEIVSNYHIDGIQFDDHFGYPTDFGYDYFTLQLYQAEHDGKLPPDDFQNPAWIRWRADKITEYMSDLFQAIKKANPNVLVSLSPNPQDFSFNSYLLDWETWERKGLIEELIIQVYRTEMADFIGELEQPEVMAAKEHIPVGIGILSGLKGRPVPLDRIKNQLEAVRDRSLAGVSFFFYESLWHLGEETPEQRKSTFQSLFSPPLPRPSLLHN